MVGEITNLEQKINLLSRMAKHNVFVTLPERELGKVDVLFNIRTNGRKAGTITVSKGGIEWYPANSKKPYKLGWKRFDKAIRGYYGDV